MIFLSAWLIDKGINYIFYFLLIAVNFYIVKQLIESPLKLKLARYKYDRLRKMQMNEQMDKTLDHLSPFIRHFYLLIESTSKEKGDYKLASFFISSGMLFLTTAVVIFFNVKQDFVLSIMLGFLAGTIPYGYLHVRLKSIRNTVGNELLSVVQALTQNYNANNYDIYRGLADTANSIKDQNLKNVFYRLISDMQVSRTEGEMRRGITFFIYTCGNSWSKRLGNIILKAYLFDEKVLNSLINLSKQMENTEAMLQEEKSAAHDSITTGFIAPFIFLASLALGYYVSGPQDWFTLQFLQPYSILTFVLALAFNIVAIFIALLLRNPKNDI